MESTEQAQYTAIAETAKRFAESVFGLLDGSVVEPSDASDQSDEG